MFNATYFTYDGTWSGQYGLKIASFDDSQKEETTIFSPTLTTTKTPRSNKFFKTSVRHDSPSQFPLTIVSEKIIEENTRREIMSWLVGRNNYKKLTLHQPDLERYTYYCIFTEVSAIFINGHCVGFNLTANLNSSYQFGTPNVSTYSSDTGSVMNVVFYNPSDITDDYVYPTVKFTSKGVLDSNQTVISIINSSDDMSRAFAFDKIQANSYSTETITVNNEMRSIKSSSGIKSSLFLT